MDVSNISLRKNKSIWELFDFPDTFVYYTYERLALVSINYERFTLIGINYGRFVLVNIVYRDVSVQIVDGGLK